MKNSFYPDSDSLDVYLEKIGKIPRLTHKEAIELTKKIEKGDQEAKKEMIERNLQLVVFFAKKYRKYLFGPDLSFFELILEGNCGLIDAVEKFDWRRGRKFSTFAKKRILNPIRKALYDKSKAIRIPRGQLLKFHNLRKSFEKLNRQLENSSNNGKQKKIVAEMNLLDKKLEEFYKKLPLNVLYLQQPISDNSDSLLGDFVEDSNLIPVEEQIGETELAEKVRRVLSRLPPREEKILRLRFGIGEKSDHTLTKIGKRFRLSRERIRQIEAKTLKKLSHNPSLKNA